MTDHDAREAAAWLGAAYDDDLVAEVIRRGLDVPAALPAPVPEQREQVAQLLLTHWRTPTSGCTCGGMKLGESYPHHVADALLSLLPEDGLRQRVEALAEQWSDMARDHDEQGFTTTAMVFRAHARQARRALGQTSAVTHSAAGAPSSPGRL